MTGRQQIQSRFPLQIASRDDTVSPALETLIRRHARKLATFNDRIVRCRVMVETPHRHLTQGARHSVRLDLTVPGRELVVRKAGLDLETAIQDAFSAAERRLKDQAAARRARRTRENDDLRIRA